MSKIKFGTSGWRAVIAEDFTFQNVRTVVQAISEYLLKNRSSRQSKQPSVVVGGDTRFLSEKFAEVATEVLCGNGIKTYLANRDIPTPVISFEILRRHLDGGINFTASHNPYQYQGLKFSPATGGPATPDVTKAIEQLCDSPKLKIKSIDLKTAAKEKLLETIDPSQGYIRQIKSLIDIDAIKKTRTKAGVHLLYGTARGYLDTLLVEECGVNASIIGDERDVLFGKSGSPEPNKSNLNELVEMMKREKLNIGLAVDGDADRFGIIDEDGSFLTPNLIISILMWHLIKTRSWKGFAVRSVMTTHLIDKIAGKLGAKVIERPVGFKYIGEEMVKDGSVYPSKKGNFIIGGEESGGLTIRGHIPEKDGILACLLVLEAIAIHKKSLKEIAAEIMSEIGTNIYSDRINFHLDEKQMETLRNRLSKNPPKELGELKVEKLVTLDGYKFIFDDGVSWLGVRLSGTEPVARLYVESDKESKLKKLSAIGEDFLNS